MVKVAGMTPEADIGWSAAEPGLCHFPLDTRRKVLGFWVGTHRTFIKWIDIQEVNSRMRRSSGLRSSRHQPLKPPRP